MTPDWSPLRAELSAWRTAGLTLPLWWRDDDAVDATPELNQLLALGTRLSLPVHIAVIPEPAKTALAALCEGHPIAVPLVHGWCHENKAPEGAKKAEFGHPRTDAKNHTAQALTRMRDLFGTDLVEVFVPPWNRIDDTVVAGLAGQGYRALSTYTPRKQRCVAGLVQINTHVDPIHWKAGGGLVPPDTVIAKLVETLRARRRGEADSAEPLGFLTHHLVHDADIWAFTQACLSELLEGGAVVCNLRDMRGALP